MCLQDVTNSSSWDFCKIKSGCVNSSLQQQQSVQPGSHLNPSHWANSTPLGKSPHSWMICSIPLNHPGIIEWSRSQYNSWVWPSTNVAFHIRTLPFWCIQLWLGLFGIFCAERASSACFWWLGALSKQNRPVANPFVRSSKISIALSTCWIRSSAVKYPSQFFPALKMIQASLHSSRTSVKLSLSKN